MNITLAKIKIVMALKGYKWFDDRPNIISIRSKMNVPNIFNDILLLSYQKANIEKYYSITTDPGTTYLAKPINDKGCFILKPGQYVNCWALGYHQSKTDHMALRQVGNMTGYRDNDKDNEFDMIPGTEETGYAFGVNCHGAVKNADTKQVGPWSAGCQVFMRWKEKEEFVSIIIDFEKKNKSLWKKIVEWVFGKSGITYSYTLLEEKDFDNV